MHGQCGRWSLFYYLLHVPVACQREAQEPTPMDLTAISQQGALARHPATVVVRRGRGWIFTLMEGGKGGVFANNP